MLHRIPFLAKRIHEEEVDAEFSKVLMTFEKIHLHHAKYASHNRLVFTLKVILASL